MSQKKIYCFILYAPFSNPVCISRFTCPCVCPSFYGDVSPMSTRIISRFRRVLTCQVDTPITGCTPYRSVRAQLRHTALHDTNASDYP